MDSRKRSTLFTLGAIAMGYVTLRSIPSLLPEKLELKELDAPFGFRKYAAGSSSGGFDPFVGMGAPDGPEILARKELALVRVKSNICTALYGDLDALEGKVPMASFSDYYCPYCRVQTKRLFEMTKAKPNDVTVAWHELPLLGDVSNLAAKAALAAKRQGAYVQFHEKLMKSPFQASPEYLALLAKVLDIDEDQMISDMESSDILLELENSSALARLFAFVGTPALVIGRTIVQGQISDKMIKKIIDLEREEGWEAACTSTSA